MLSHRPGMTAVVLAGSNKKSAGSTRAFPAIRGGRDYSPTAAGRSTFSDFSTMRADLPRRLRR
jgi:hypothetical protein